MHGGGLIQASLPQQGQGGDLASVFLAWQLWLSPMHRGGPTYSLGGDPAAIAKL